MSADPTVIVGGARTGMGRLLGSLKDFSATDLGGFAIAGALEKSGVSPEQVDYEIMGLVLQAGAGQMPARQSAVNAGIPMDVPTITINKVCLSGLDAIALADQLIRAGEVEIVVAGGQESMTNAPHLLLKTREGYKYGDVTMRDHMAYEGLWDVFTDQAMGALTDQANTGEYAFSREEQDAFAARSHELAARAWKDGVFDDEVEVRRVDAVLGAGLADRVGRLGLQGGVGAGHLAVRADLGEPLKAELLGLGLAHDDDRAGAVGDL